MCLWKISGGLDKVEGMSHEEVTGSGQSVESVETSCGQCDDIVNTRNQGHTKPTHLRDERLSNAVATESLVLSERLGGVRWRVNEALRRSQEERRLELIQCGDGTFTVPLWIKESVPDRVSFRGTVRAYSQMATLLNGSLLRLGHIRTRGIPCVHLHNDLLEHENADLAVWAEQARLSAVATSRRSALIMGLGYVGGLDGLCNAPWIGYPDLFDASVKITMAETALVRFLSATDFASEASQRWLSSEAYYAHRSLRLQLGSLSNDAAIDKCRTLLLDLYMSRGRRGWLQHELDEGTISRPEDIVNESALSKRVRHLTTSGHIVYYVPYSVQDAV